MIDHRAAEALLATAIDFPLTADERATLDQHLADCDRCRMVAGQLRRQVAAMENLAAEDAPSRIRGAVESAALQGSTTNARFTLLLAAALLLALAVSGAALVGSGLLDLDWLSVNPVPPVESASPGPSPESPAPPAEVALPTGTLIAYVERSGSTSFVHTVEPDGSDDQTLAEGWFAAWSPDGLALAYGCSDANQVEHVCVMGADGAEQAVFDDDYSAPWQWSPGRQILFGHVGDYPITWIANPDGTGIRQLADGKGTWSPDGSLIMLVRISSAPPSGAPVISVIRPDGSGLRDLGEGYSAAWSPDSSQIAFVMDDALRAYDVADGSVSTLHEGIPSGGGSLHWVTDDLMVFGSDAGLYLMDLQSGDVELASDLAVALFSPVLSPDGQWLAFTASEGDAYQGDAADIYLAPIAGGGVIQLTTGGNSNSPAWQPIAPSASSGRPPLDLPPVTDAGTRAIVAEAGLSVYGTPSTDSRLETTLESGTEVFISAGPLAFDGQDWYEVYFSWLPEDPPYFQDMTHGWVAVGPAGTSPSAIRLGSPQCPQDITAEAIGAMTAHARLQCLGSGSHEVTGVLVSCTDICGWNIYSAEGYPLFLFFSSEYPAPAGLEWFNEIRVVGHVNDPSCEPSEPLPDESPQDCRGRFFVTELEITGQSEPLF